MRATSLNQKLAARAVRDSGSGCILWTGCIGRLGYGQINHRGKYVAAHRAAFECAYGPIPAGMKVLHKCDVRNCVNPEHLRLGTQRENVLDMLGKGRAPDRSGPKNGRAKLAPDQVQEIRASTDSHAALGRRYGVTPTLIALIRKGNVWRQELAHNGPEQAAS